MSCLCVLCNVISLVMSCVDLKLKLKEVEKSSLESNAFDRQAMESLLTKRFFIAPSFEIYGGVAGMHMLRSS